MIHQEEFKKVFNNKLLNSFIPPFNNINIELEQSLLNNRFYHLLLNNTEHKEKKKMLYTTSYNSPIGKISLASDGNKINGLWIEGQKYFSNIVKSLIKQDDLPVFTRTKEWLDNYFLGQNPSISDLALSPQGGAFRQAVWKILCEIPAGQTISYGAIAKKIALQTKQEKMSAQAVGGAVGHNPISIIIPCHRVVGANGNLTGYAGGIKLKVKLLELEGVNTSNLSWPKTI